ncbi:hypothetical protein BT67DRAFT_441392 [Trichocladium antarcticum]|uniref:Uncharacterized protein n=1 Tax=Trichocladium antarcticum TaxID=1450529 RepID=A0AAN6ULI8_9PEZI|nr:hypothetical protein BT67DRAFT_441392 [Trichocladium antarcticum]
MPPTRARPPTKRNAPSPVAGRAGLRCAVIARLRTPLSLSLACAASLPSARVVALAVRQIAVEQHHPCNQLAARYASSPHGLRDDRCDEAAPSCPIRQFRSGHRDAVAVAGACPALPCPALVAWPAGLAPNHNRRPPARLHACRAGQAVD